MKLTRLKLLSSILLLTPTLTFACGGDDGGDNPSSGGSTSTGSTGNTGTGGSENGSGGANGTGSMPGSGGTTGTGGSDATAQVPGTDGYDCSAPSGTPGELALVDYATGFDRPVYVAHPPNDDRLFVVEQNGAIKIVKRVLAMDGVTMEVVTNPTPFLDITEKAISPVDEDKGGYRDEQGVLGLAFHPNYAQNGLFYVHYNANDDDTEYERNDTVIAEYKVSADNPDVADANSERLVIHQRQRSDNHNGGSIVFGSDGYLYIALGDEGGGNDTHGNGQNATTILGAILRIDPLASGENAYSVPTGNLKDVMPTAAPEIWDMGLRNPYRVNFDACNGDFYIGDVGQLLREEINVEPVGEGQKNYGWNTMEGLICFDKSDPENENFTGCDQNGLTLPVLDYDHDDGKAVIGGSVYRGSEIPWLRGTYFYADSSPGKIWSFKYDRMAKTISDETNHTADLSPSFVTAIQNDSQGEILVVQGDGRIRKLTAL